MKKNTGVAVALAAAILASGGGLASSVITATPAQAATSTTTPAPVSAPLRLAAFSSPTAPVQGQVVWQPPTGVVGQVTHYIVTIKQVGKPDRILTTSNTQLPLSGLTENTSYVIAVKANIYTPTTGRMSYSPEAVTTLRTTYFATSVVATPPVLSLVGVTHETASVDFKTPPTTVGKVESYKVTVRKGSEIVRIDTVPNTSATSTNLATRYFVAPLQSNTAYSIEVTAKVASLSGTSVRYSAPSIISFTTAKSPVVSVAPTTVNVPYFSLDTATVVWQKPVVNGSLVNYAVNVRSASTGQLVTSRQLSPETTNTRVSGLQPNTTYIVDVIAFAKSEDGRNGASSIARKAFLTPAR